jgi:hypothetical protein
VTVAARIRWVTRAVGGRGGVSGLLFCAIGRDVLGRKVAGVVREQQGRRWVLETSTCVLQRPAARSRTGERQVLSVAGLQQAAGFLVALFPPTRNPNERHTQRARHIYCYVSYTWSVTRHAA